MILELKHFVNGAFGLVYAEEQCWNQGEREIRKALSALRGEWQSALWIYDFTKSTDIEDITAVGALWDSGMHHENKQLKIIKSYGHGNKRTEEILDWEKGRKFLKKFIEENRG